MVFFYPSHSNSRLIRMAQHNRFIQSFTRIPKDIFRVNSGISIRLRAWPGPRRPHGVFDLLTTGGKVQPKALDPATYEFPNGASMRPNSRTQQNLVRTVKPGGGSAIYVYAIMAGTALPSDLILVHEFRDHYSLQARKEMTVEELNAKIEALLTTKGQRFTKDEWLQQYPQATD